MNAKKTTKVLRGLAVAGCFMIAQQTVAQSWSNVGYKETSSEIYVINNDESNRWTALRLQSSDDHGWNINNEGFLWWGYANNGSNSDRGTERMRLTADGKLGIGSSSPNARLSFGTTTEDRIIGLFDSATDWYGLGISNYTMRLQVGGTSSRFAFYAGDNTEVMRVQGNGNVGIGTTSPSEKLEVAGVTSSQGLRIPGRYAFGQVESGIEMEVASSDYNAIRGFNGTDHVGTIHFFDDTWGSGAPGNSAGAININGDVATTIGPWNNPVAYFRNSDGNVGIGTASPGSSLSFGTTVKDRILGLYDNTSAWYGFGISNYTMRLQVGNSSARFAFYAGDNTEVMRIQGDGNVGIGITSPSQKLDVDGTVKATSFTSSTASFPDYVFAEDYEITPLAELERYVKTNKRLPNMPSEKEVVEQGLNIPEVVTKSVENIEVIYLHLIRMEKKIEALAKENANLKQQLKQGR